MMVNNEGTRIAVRTPYDREFVKRAHALGGRWDAARSIWVFPADVREQVEMALREVFGYEVGARKVVADIVLKGTVKESELRMAGRVILARPGRDTAVRAGEGVSIIAGTLEPRGGSARYPEIGNVSGVRVRVRELYAGALDIIRRHPNVDSVELVNEAPEVVIVTRHSAVVEWLRRRGITGDVISHVEDVGQVAGKIVVGNLPLHLASQAVEVWAVEFENLPAEKRGQELTVEEMEQYGAVVRKYRVTAL